MAVALLAHTSPLGLVALIGGIGVWEVLLVLLVVLVVFGPSKLPQLGEGIGKMLRGFKKEMKSLDEDNPEKNAARAEIDKGSARDEIDVTPKTAAETDAKRTAS